MKLVEDYINEAKDTCYFIGLSQPNSYNCIETNIKDYVISSCFIKELSSKSAELDSLDKKLKFYKYFFYFIYFTSLFTEESVTDNNLDEYELPSEFQRTYISKYVDDMKKIPRVKFSFCSYLKYRMNTILQWVYSFFY